MRARPAGAGRWRSAAAALVVSLALLAPPGAFAAGFATQAFPVPVNVELERVRSSLLLEFEIQRYGVPFETFAAGRLDAPEAAFRDFMSALRSGDVARAAALRPGDTSAEVRQVVAGFHEGFTRPQTPKVVARIAAGDGQVFVWEWPGPGGPVRLAFEVVGTRDAPRVEVVTSARPLQTLILDLMQQEALHPGRYAAVEPRRRYKYAFPLAGAGRTGAHPVVLHFDGEPMNLVVMGAERSQPAGRAAAAAGVFQAAYAALEDRDLERYWSAYTDKSRDKLRAWIEAMTPAELGSFFATHVRPRRVRFLLDADPVALVFYTVEADEHLRYEYLLKSPRGYQLTNAYFEGFLDDVLGSPALFATDAESLRRNVLGVTHPK